MKVLKVLKRAALGVFGAGAVKKTAEKKAKKAVSPAAAETAVMNGKAAKTVKETAAPSSAV